MYTTRNVINVLYMIALSQRDTTIGSDRLLHRTCKVNINLLNVLIKFYKTAK